MVEKCGYNLYCPLVRGECRKKDCIMYHVDAEKGCVLFAFLYRKILEGK